MHTVIYHYCYDYDYYCYYYFLLLLSLLLFLLLFILFCIGKSSSQCVKSSKSISIIDLVLCHENVLSNSVHKYFMYLYVDLV